MSRRAPASNRASAKSSPEDRSLEADSPRVIPRPDHRLSRKQVDSDALKVLYRLHNNGYRAFLVGGSVRDLLVGKAPKDFDIVTDARPRRLKKLFKNCRIIGRRFQLAHLRFGPTKIIEVATFRSSPEHDEVERDGELIRRDNVFGTPSEDAHRRDLTINGLFYDIADFSIIDFVGGVQDLEAGVVRMIRDPIQSFREDPVRMLRAVRHAVRLDFEIDADTTRALESERDEILKANPSRLLEELYKDLSNGYAEKFFGELLDRGFFECLLPGVDRVLDDPVSGARSEGEAPVGEDLLLDTLARLDEHVASSGEEVGHATALACLLAPVVLPLAREISGTKGGNPVARFRSAIEPLFVQLKIYRRDADRLWHLLGAWPKLAAGFERGKVPKSIAGRRYFPEAVTVFSLLEEDTSDLAQFVEQCRSAIPDQPDEDEDETTPRRRRRRSGRRGGRSRRGGRASD